MPLRMEVGLGLGDFVFSGDPASSRKKCTAHTQFLAHVYCGQTAEWMKTPLGAEVDLGPGSLCWSGAQLPPAKGAQHPPLFGPCLLLPPSPISAAAELLLNLLEASLFETQGSCSK